MSGKSGLRAALTAVGALAAVALAAFYLMLGTPGPAELLAMIRGEQRIAPGFIGVANFGQWRLICMPAPQTLDELGAAAAPAAAGAEAAKTARANACRVNQEMPAPEQNSAPGDATGETPRQVIIAANFSLVGAKRTPAAMLRLPSTARAGDVITLRFDDETEVRTMVRACAGTECMAAGTLSDADWTRLSAARSFQVTFPAAGRQWVLLNLPVEGLAAAIAAMDRAEISAPD